MWPGDQQSGGQQHPQGSPTPPQQPPGGYGQPNPYAQPVPPPPSQPAGYPQQGQPPAPQPGQQPPYAAPTQPYGTPAPSPYAQPGYQQQGGGYPTPQQWGPPVPGGPGGQPPKNRNNLTIAIAVTAAVAVIAAVVVGAVYLTGGDKKNSAQDDKSPTPTATATASTPTATPTPTGTGGDAGGGGDNPRGAPVDVEPVIPGWKVVERDQRNVLFDVPPDWNVGSQGMTIGFSDKTGNPAVAMSGPAYYKHDFCSSGSSTFDRGAAGTKGANGATSVRNAAEVQATAWAYWAYQTDGKGTFSKVLDSKAFHNAHGISGWQARATATNVPVPTKCASPAGEAFTVAWLDPTQSDPTKKLVVWVLYADRGVPDALAQSTIDKIKSSIRLIKTK
ncbi:hypothetical protein [Actinacidiphila rubida]|uniref:DUF8017 domain-containing protein n=1 Tax=Actinacidiphila rubida TaxID=310780 RepID=A0A1H8NH36_9ACTN|nr:hypothetical protein [Actinacidiphila rubida]SEO28703.1 hypothetical protein SAMN05216267_102238 [Actinacidiphila rubida]